VINVYIRENHVKEQVHIISCEVTQISCIIVRYIPDVIRKDVLKCINVFFSTMIGGQNFSIINPCALNRNFFIHRIKLISFILNQKLQKKLQREIEYTSPLLFTD